MALPTTPDAYQAHLNEEFVLRHEGGSHRGTLHAVDRNIDDPVQCCFSLLFRFPGLQLPQGTYPLAHPSLGEVDLFLVPIRQRREGILYEAVFNLLKDEPQ